MKNKTTTLLAAILMICTGGVFAQSQTPKHATKPAQTTTNNRYVPAPYVPGNVDLYKTIARLDSIYFDAYNHSKPEVIQALTSENLEFYHDRSGLSTSKTEYLEALKKNIYGKVTRTLTPGSLEVYEIPGYGAIEFGYHSFRNIAEPGESHPSKFVIIWQHKGDQWQLSRVISLH